MTDLAGHTPLKCRICSNDRQWHIDNSAKHRFTVDGNLELAEQPTPPRPVAVPSGGDPVLRIALIRAGLISTEDIDRAEEDLRSARTTGEPIVIIPDPRSNHGLWNDGGTEGSMRPSLPFEEAGQGSQAS